MTSIQETAGQIQSLMDPSAANSPMALTSAAQARAFEIADALDEVLQGATSQEAARLAARYRWAAAHIGQALAEIAAAEGDRDLLLNSWGLVPAEVLPIPRADEAATASPAMTKAAETAAGSDTARSYYRSPAEQREGPTPRLSDQDLFAPELQQRLDMPIEDVLGLTPEQRDLDVKQSPLSRLQRTGIRTLRDAITVQNMALSIYGLQLNPDEYKAKIRAACPEIPVFGSAAVPGDPPLSDGERAAQFCRSLEQVPLQYLSSGRRNPEMYHRQITVADVIDPDTNEPIQPGGSWGTRRIRGLPSWYGPDDYRKVVAFVRDFRLTRHKLYGEE